MSGCSTGVPHNKTKQYFFPVSERCFDIYVGIDVFGRGCPGGGGFDSNKALTMIKYHSLSTAIFAPGLTP